MLLERIESPVPDWTQTPAGTLKAIVLPERRDGPADRVGGCIVAEDHAVDFVAQRRLAGDVGPDQVALDQVRPLAAVPSSRTPQLLAEIRFRAAAVVPPIGIAGGPQNGDPLLGVRNGVEPGLVGADQVAFDQVAGGCAPEITTP